MAITSAPERLAKMLLDCHSSIRAAYYYTQDRIDQIERPCFLIFVEDAAFKNETVEQDLVDQSYSIAYVGHVFNATGDVDVTFEYEQRAREIADAAVQYLFEHPQMQMSDNRGIETTQLNSLDGVQYIRVDNRSAVTLFTRDGVSGNAFWGFTIDITSVEQFEYTITGIA